MDRNVTLTAGKFRISNLTFMFLLKQRGDGSGVVPLRVQRSPLVPRPPRRARGHRQRRPPLPHPARPQVRRRGRRDAQTGREGSGRAPSDHRSHG